jgi:serine/threonine protein phosphatase 1
MSKIYAISDIHGCSKTFNELLNKISFSTNDTLYLLGDYIDRGPGSIQTIDKVIELQSSGYNIKCLRGNHEQMMLNSIQHLSQSILWEKNGGDKVLDELGIHSASQIPQKYINFIEGLPYYIETDDFFFVHAGLNLQIPDPLQDKESMIWIRNWEDSELVSEFLDGKKLIHGHTPQSNQQIEKTFGYFCNGYVSVLNIDNGCVFQYPNYNSLCLVNLTDGKLSFQPNIEY